MNNIKILADSTCDLPKNFTESLDITIIPLHVNFEEETYEDGIDITTEELFEKVKEKGILPKTAAITPGDFENIFRQYLDEGFKIIFLGIGSKFSATVQNANIAKRMLESEDIFIIDTQNITCGFALLVLKAIKFRNLGLPAEEIYQEVLKLVPKVKGSFTVESLEYLYKGGRLNQLAGGEISLTAKPIVSVFDGRLGITEKYSQSIELSMENILNDMITNKDKIDEDYVLIMHSLAYDRLKVFKERLTNTINAKVIEGLNTGCVIASHCGKGTIGVYYIEK